MPHFGVSASGPEGVSGFRFQFADFAFADTRHLKPEEGPILATFRALDMIEKRFDSTQQSL